MVDRTIVKMAGRILLVVLLHVGLSHDVGGVVCHEGLLVLKQNITPVRQVLLLKLSCAAYLLLQLLNIALMPLRHVVE
jgi:hypothetical protein